jgi:AraC-like DNA-binding protein
MNTAPNRHRLLAEQIVEVIRERYSDPGLSVRDVARSIGVSERQVRRVFDAGLTSFRAELLKRRMERAAELLAGTVFLISKVARLAGYESAPAFAAAFKRYYGASPVEWRIERGGPRRAGGPTGAFYKPAEQARARRRGRRSPSRRTALTGGDDAVLLAKIDEARARLVAREDDAGQPPAFSLDELAAETFRTKRGGRPKPGCRLSPSSLRAHGGR